MNDVYDRRIHVGGTPGARTRRPVRGQVDLSFRIRNRGDRGGRAVSAEPGFPREFAVPDAPFGLAVHDALEHVAGWDTCSPDDPPVRELMALGASLFVRGLGTYAIAHPTHGDWGMHRYAAPGVAVSQVVGTIQLLSIGGVKGVTQALTSFDRLKPPRGWGEHPPAFQSQHLPLLEDRLDCVESYLWDSRQRAEVELWDWAHDEERGGAAGREMLLQWLKAGFVEAERAYVCPLAASRLYTRVGYVLGLLTQSYPLDEGGLQAWAPVRIEGHLDQAQSTYRLRVTPPNKALARWLEQELEGYGAPRGVKVVEPEVEYMDNCEVTEVAC